MYVVPARPVRNWRQVSSSAMSSDLPFSLTIVDNFRAMTIHRRGNYMIFAQIAVWVRAIINRLHGIRFNGMD